MPRKCTVCAHKNRHLIDEEITRNAEYCDIARRYRLSRDSVRRHVENGHVSKIVTKEDEERFFDIQKAAQELYEFALDSAKDARMQGKHGAIGSCLGPAAKVLDILSKGEPANINLTVATDCDLDAKLERLIESRQA